MRCIYSIILLFATIDPSAAANPDYFGKWKFERLLPTAAGTWMRQEQVDALIGTKIEYSKEAFCSGRIKIDHPIYKENILSQADFAYGTIESRII
jgi:hypothetical protein